MRRDAPAEDRTRGSPGLIVASPVVEGDRMADGSPDWDEIQKEWRRREFGALRGEVLALPGMAVKDEDGLTLLERMNALLFSPPSQPKEDEATEPPPDVDPQEALTRAFLAVRPDDRPLLALWVYGLCLQKLEQSEDYDRIRAVREALDEGRARWQKGAAPNARALIRRIVSQAQVVDATMVVEDAMSCSCPVAMGARATDIVNRLEGLEVLPELETGDGLADFREFVRSDAKRNLLYFGTIAAVARTMEQFVQLDASERAGYDFDAVLTALTEAEADCTIKGDVYESELRAHRIALETLQERTGDPFLRIDAAELTYLYPFALENKVKDKEIDPTMTVKKSLSAGFAPADLNDLWEPHGGEPLDDRNIDERRDYSGTSLALGKIAVKTTASQILEFTAEVRLSRLGNHHLAFRFPLVGAGLHELNQALRRGSHGMGDEEFLGLEVTAFPEYAEEIIEGVASRLEARHLVNLGAPYHVVLAARSIFVERDGERSPAKLEDLKDPKVVGPSLLFHPVRHLTTAPNEWIRYPHPAVTNLLERLSNGEDPVARSAQGYEGDLVVRTDNTTVMFMPATPEWLIDEYVEMIEFVASIPPLFTLWKSRARLKAEELEAVLDDIENQIKGGGDPIQELNKKEMETRALESRIRGHLALLHSPALCRTRSQREFLNKLWEAAGLQALEDDLEHRLTLLTAEQQRVAALVSSIDRRIRRKLELPLTILIGVLAVAGLAEVLSWFNQAFVPKGRWWDRGELLLLLLITGLVLLMYAWIYGRRTLTRWFRPRPEEAD